MVVLDGDQEEEATTEMIRPDMDFWRDERLVSGDEDEDEDVSYCILFLEWNTMLAIDVR